MNKLRLKPSITQLINGKVKAPTRSVWCIFLSITWDLLIFYTVPNTISTEINKRGTVPTSMEWIYNHSHSLASNHHKLQHPSINHFESFISIASAFTSIIPWHHLICLITYFTWLYMVWFCLACKISGVSGITWIFVLSLFQSTVYKY